jgi:hypothetical protein
MSYSWEYLSQYSEHGILLIIAERQQFSIFVLVLPDGRIEVI